MLGQAKGPAHGETRLTRGTENRGEASLSPLELPRTPLDFQVALMSGWRGRGEGLGGRGRKWLARVRKTGEATPPFHACPTGPNFRKVAVALLNRPAALHGSCGPPPLRCGPGLQSGLWPLSRMLSRHSRETFGACQGQEYVCVCVCGGALLFLGTK